MNPYGLVDGGVDDLPDVDAHAVASIASSLTSAMLTVRKMFSSSFVSSAASGVETADDVVADLAVQLDGAVAAGLGQPGDDLRRGAQRVVRAAGIDALGREREVEVARPRRGPTPRAPAATARAWCRDTSSTRARRAARPAERPASARVAETSGPRSGSRLAVSGVGTQTTIASQREVRRARRRIDAAQRRLQPLVRDVLDVRVAALRASILRASTSTATTSCPSSANATASGRPT